MKRLPFFLILALFLSSCVTALSTDTQLSVWKDELWELETVFVLSEADVQAYGALINQSLNQHVNEMLAGGIEAEWVQEESSQAGEISYRISLKGEGYEILNQHAFNGKNVLIVDETDKGRLIRFQYYPSNDFFDIVLEERFTLRGGRIISSNGQVIDNHTVTWVNPQTTMEAVITEGARSVWVTYTVAIVFVLILAWMAVKYLRPKPTSQVWFEPTKSSLLPATKYCSECGSLIPSEASFCPGCGHMQ